MPVNSDVCEASVVGATAMQSVRMIDSAAMASRWGVSTRWLPMNPNWSARVVSIEMTMTCRGGRPPSSEQAESVEARARVVKAVVKVLDAVFPRMRRIESPARRRTARRFIRDRLLTGPNS